VLRLEAKMALYSSDIDATTTVLEADLLFILKIDRGVRRPRGPGRAEARRPARRLVGFELRGRIARQGREIVVEGAPFGR
jgi:glycine cleavage system aminomethyltransferase T